ncbi:unnamed protein product [Caenorhabditis bovis]|uniref:COMM domain-containing protein n=1 Tax=Caenorhabditis bovis TaxID=2654633 RepID=A0A8S1F6P4_9PELO|nr:unnamed protein product [Caenorhabditis bovis]
MKFHFLGGTDCPDWLLNQICRNFAQFTVLRFRTLCAQAVELQLRYQINEEALRKFYEENMDMQNVHNSIKLIGEWLLLKPAGFKCSADDLQAEMVQLGLPLEHAEMLGKIYNQYRDEMEKKAAESVFREPAAMVVDKTDDGISLESLGKITKITMSKKQMNELTQEMLDAHKTLRELVIKSK